MEQSSLEVTVDKALVGTWIAGTGSDASAAVPLLQAVQNEYGYLPREAMDIIVAETDITASQLFGVATFYSQFRLDPVGRHVIKVCHGTACHVSGADRINTALRQSLGISDEGEDTASNGSYTIEDVACIGCCSLAPVMVIGAGTFGNLKGADAQRSLKKHARDHGEFLPGHEEEKSEADAPEERESPSVKKKEAGS